MLAIAVPDLSIIRARAPGVKKGKSDVFEVADPTVDSQTLTLANTKADVS